MTVIIDGKKTAENILLKLKDEVSDFEKKPTLIVFLVGSNPASKVYVRNKRNAAAKLGINSIIEELPDNISQEDLEKKVIEANNNKDINAILVQLPLPKGLNAKKIVQTISPEKDVDGFTPCNVGQSFIGGDPYSYSCTPKGVIRLLDEYKIPIEGKNVVIIGRSNIVGKPLFNLMLNRNATVTVCHSKTQNLNDFTNKADILVSAVGQPGLVKKEMVKQGAVVIDVGITRLDNGKLTGDIDFDDVKGSASFITPVPGGVGPMTIAMLMENTIELFKKQL